MGFDGNQQESCHHIPGLGLLQPEKTGSEPAFGARNADMSKGRAEQPQDVAHISDRPDQAMNSRNSCVFFRNGRGKAGRNGPSSPEIPGANRIDSQRSRMISREIPNPAHPTTSSEGFALSPPHPAGSRPGATPRRAPPALPCHRAVTSFAPRNRASAPEPHPFDGIPPNAAKNALKLCKAPIG